MSNFTQPICEDCWFRLNGDRQAVRMIHTTRETCCHCGKATESGIYVRVDPKTVAYPTKERK